MLRGRAAVSGSADALGGASERAAGAFAVRPCVRSPANRLPLAHGGTLGSFRRRADQSESAALLRLHWTGRPSYVSAAATGQPCACGHRDAADRSKRLELRARPAHVPRRRQKWISLRLVCAGRGETGDAAASHVALRSGIVATAERS